MRRSLQFFLVSLVAVMALSGCSDNGVVGVDQKSTAVSVNQQPVVNTVPFQLKVKNTI